MLDKYSHYYLFYYVFVDDLKGGSIISAWNSNNNSFCFKVEPVFGTYSIL